MPNIRMNPDAESTAQLAVYLNYLEKEAEESEALIKRVEQGLRPLAGILKGVEKHYVEKLTPGIEEKVKQEVFEKEVEQRRARMERLKVVTISNRSFFECPVCKSDKLALTPLHGFTEKLCCQNCGLSLQANQGFGNSAEPVVDTLQKLWNSFAREDEQA